MALRISAVEITVLAVVEGFHRVGYLRLSI